MEKVASANFVNIHKRDNLLLFFTDAYAVYIFFHLIQFRIVRVKLIFLLLITLLTRLSK